MAVDKQFPVYGDDGLRGTLFAPARFLDTSSQKRIKLEDGREILVPSEALVPEPDGSFYLKGAATFLNKPQANPAKTERVAATSVEVAGYDQPRVQTPPRGDTPPKPAPPPRAEPPKVGAKLDPALKTESGPSEAPRAQERPNPASPSEAKSLMYEQSFQDALFRDDCDVKRVPIRKLVDTPPEPRQEGDTWVVPLVEEILVVEKRLLLREELHITRRREQRPDPKPIRLEDLQLDGK